MLVLKKEKEPNKGKAMGKDSRNVKVVAAELLDHLGNLVLPGIMETYHGLGQSYSTWDL